MDVRTSAPSNGKDGEGIVRFESRDIVTQLLHKTLVLNGTEVKVKPFYVSTRMTRVLTLRSVHFPIL